MLIDAIWRMLRTLPPDTAYKIVHSTPRQVSRLQAEIDGRTSFNAPVTLLGNELENPVGLAAGLDKDGRITWTSWSIGFGYTVVGSILPYPYEGAKNKILLRLPDGALINRLGLPSEGVDRVVSRLRKSRPPIPLVVNIASLDVEGYRIVYEKACIIADWFEVNISCPNTREHTTFEKPGEAEKILEALRQAECRKPLLLKIPPTRDEDLLREYAELVLEKRVEGIVASNTAKTTVNGVQAGLSGPPLYNTVRFMVEKLRELLPESKVIVGVGGIDTVEKALEILEYANAIELLTTLLYHGPKRVREIIEGVSKTISRR